MPSSKKDVASFLIPSSSIGIIATSSNQPQQQQYGRRAQQQQGASDNKNNTVSTKNDPKVNFTSQQQQQGGGGDYSSSASASITLPKYGNLALSTGSQVKSVIRTDADHFPRGFAQPHDRPIDVGGFRCTSRGSSRLIALPDMNGPSSAVVKKNNINNNKVDDDGNSSAAAGVATPDVSIIAGSNNHNQVKLRDVWKFGMRAKAPLLTEIDPSEIGRAVPAVANDTTTKNEEGGASNNNSSTKKVIKFVRIQPEYLSRGMVQPPQAEVVEVDTKVLDDDAAHLMNPRQRRELMEAQRKAREGLVALREVQAAKTKLSRTCQKLYPHGSLGIEDGPYSSDPDQTAYQGLSKELSSEATKVGRKGKKDAGGFARPHNTADLVLNRDVNSTNFFTGDLDETKTIGNKALEKNFCGVDPTRQGGLRTRGTCKPKDQLRMFAVGV